MEVVAILHSEAIVHVFNQYYCSDICACLLCALGSSHVVFFVASLDMHVCMCIQCL